MLRSGAERRGGPYTGSSRSTLSPSTSTTPSPVTVTLWSGTSNESVHVDVGLERVVEFHRFTLIRGGQRVQQGVHHVVYGLRFGMPWKSPP